VETKAAYGAKSFLFDLRQAQKTMKAIHIGATTKVMPTATLSARSAAWVPVSGKN
jgi:hypothetical protein